MTLLPLFRSQTQALVLTRLLLGPGEESFTDLAVVVGAYKNAVKHEVDRLEAAGLVSSRAVGRSRLVSVSAEEPIRSILLDLVLHTYGPVHVVGEELSSVAGITHAFTYGSWAARYAREPGPRRAISTCWWSELRIVMTSSTWLGGPRPDWVRRSTSMS